MTDKPIVKIIGAGLAGCEAAYQAAKLGAFVELYEMKPEKYSPAHHFSGFAELVCSNSLRSADTSNAVGLLKKNGHILVDDGGYITLTESGREIAAMIVERHRVITEFLVELGVPREIAADDACKMEHIISDETFQKMKEHASNSPTV
jgi:2-polyprenyl-6-methoxyphenol hydroxylase-like FAD-dependent oxidoreductase